MLLKPAQTHDKLASYAVRAMIREFGAERAFVRFETQEGTASAQFGFEGVTDFEAEAGVHAGALKAAGGGQTILILDSKTDERLRDPQARRSVLCVSLSGKGYAYCDHSEPARLGHTQRDQMGRLLLEYMEQSQKLDQDLQRRNSRKSGPRYWPVALVMMLVAGAPWLYQFWSAPAAAPPTQQETLNLVISGTVEQEVREPLRVTVKMHELNQEVTFNSDELNWDPERGTYQIELPVSRPKALTKLGFTFRSKGKLRYVRLNGVEVKRGTQSLMAEVPPVTMRLPDPGEGRDPRPGRPRGGLVQRQVTPEKSHKGLAEKLERLEARFEKENAGRPKLKPAQ